MSEFDNEQRPTKPAPESPHFGYYAMLLGVYQTMYGIFLLLYRGKRDPLERATGLDVALLSLATLRISKAISEDEITAVVRDPVVETAGGERRPRGRGLRWALGKLVLCPTCTGTWVAAILAYALHLFPRQTRPLLVIMAASGAAQITDAVLSLVYTDRDLLRRQEDD